MERSLKLSLAWEAQVQVLDVRYTNPWISASGTVPAGGSSGQPERKGSSHRAPHSVWEGMLPNFSAG